MKGYKIVDEPSIYEESRSLVVQRRMRKGQNSGLPSPSSILLGFGHALTEHYGARIAYDGN